jgi:hypothetical protein
MNSEKSSLITIVKYPLYFKCFYSVQQTLRLLQRHKFNRLIRNYTGKETKNAFIRNVTIFI